MHCLKIRAVFARFVARKRVGTGAQNTSWSIMTTTQMRFEDFYARAAILAWEDFART
jgi:hypothetical protein